MSSASRLISGTKPTVPQLNTLKNACATSVHSLLAETSSWFKRKLWQDVASRGKMLIVICLMPMSSSSWIRRTAFTTFSKFASGSPQIGSQTGGQKSKTPGSYGVIWIILDVHPPEIWYFNDFQCVFVGFDPIPLLLWWPIPSSTTEERRRPCRRSFAEKRAAWCQSYWGWKVQLGLQRYSVLVQAVQETYISNLYILY